MRGEHVVGANNLTWVKGARENLDEASRKNLAAGPKRANTVSSAKAMEYAGGFDATAPGHSGTSIFDPVLCELAYRWFCPPGGLVLDPFAGGSVRGIIASRLGRRYIGVDLNARQLEANRSQAQAICSDPMPVWIEGDSGNIQELAACEADFVFSCPPYADLERYSDDPRDLSTMDYQGFVGAYREIVAACVALLKPNRFACFVVGDVRGPHGVYRNLPGDTIAAFSDAGAPLYNEAILVTAIGSLPIRVGKQFESGRKLGKTHQNVLVFIKGSAKEATTAIGPVECGDVPTSNEDGETFSSVAESRKADHPQSAASIASSGPPS